VANVTYTINGKHDDKGIRDATAALEGLKKAVQTINGIIGGFIATKVFSEVKKAIDESTEAFGRQQRALSNLTLAVSKNARLTEDSLRNIISYTGKLQSSSIFGDEALQEQAAFLSTLGLTEEQIRNTLNAAVELSSAGIGSLESNISNLGKTFNGVSGSLRKIIPEFGDLTVEQLKSGEAIDLINRNYAGFAKNLADNTFEGKMTQVNNIIGDIKEKIGQVAGNVKVNLFEKFKPHLESLNAWLDDHIDTITAFVVNLPGILSRTFELIKSIAGKVFSIQYWEDYGNDILGIFQEVGNNVKDFFISIFFEIAQIIPDLFTLGWENTLNIWKKMFLEWIPSIATALSDALWNGVQKKLFGHASPDKGNGDNGGNKDNGSKLENVLAGFKSIGISIKKLTTSLGENVTDLGGVIGDSFREELELFRNDITDLIRHTDVLSGVEPPPTSPPGGEEEPEAPAIDMSDLPRLKTDLERLIEEMVSGIKNGLYNAFNLWGVAVSEIVEKVVPDLINSLGQVGTALASIAVNSPTGFLEKLGNEIWDFISRVSGISLVDSIADLGRKIGKWFSGTVLDGIAKSSFGQKVSGFFEEAGNKISGVIDSIANSGFGRFVSGAVDFIKGLDDMTLGIGKTITMIADMGSSLFASFLSGDIITQAITGFISMLTSIENLGKVLNFVGTIMDGIRLVIEPLVNEIFKPFVLILEQVGFVIGQALLPVLSLIKAVLLPIGNLLLTIMNIISPIVTVFAKIADILVSLNPVLAVFTAAIEILSEAFAWVYNTIIKPVVNAVLWIFTGVANAFIKIWNIVRDAVKKITFGLVDIGHQEKINYDDIKLQEIPSASRQYATSEEEASSADAARTGGSASYTAARDIYVNIFFQNSFVSGDAREIAIMLRNEIQLAESLGQ
jgi:phage-related protein